MDIKTVALKIKRIKKKKKTGPFSMGETISFSWAKIEQDKRHLMLLRYWHV